MWLICAARLAEDVSAMVYYGLKLLDVRIHWAGYLVDESTWEPAARIFVDVPVMAKSYVKVVKDEREKAGLMTLLEKRKRK